MGKTVNNRDIRRMARIGAGCVLALSALVAIALIIAPLLDERCRSKPTEGRIHDEVVVTGTGDGIPAIDWDFWQQVNPDVVGWITIPDTPIDYPIVQASKGSPGHYLNHDVYNRPNSYGCLYVDADCTMQSGNVLIFGHNMHGGDSAMFHTLSRFLEKESLSVVRQVVIQTPDRVHILKVRAAGSVSPYGFRRVYDFTSAGELREHYLQAWGRSPSRTKCPASDEIDKLFTLITCGSDGSMRTVVYVG
jgi:sortase B